MAEYTESGWAAYWEHASGPFADNSTRDIIEETSRDHTRDIADTFLFKDNAHDTIQLIIDGGGVAITTGVKADIMIPFNCTVQGWDIVADQSGNIVINVWKDTYANYPPTVADTVTGSEKPTLSTATKNQDLTLTTWTTAFSKGDWLRFNVDSVATVTRVTVVIRVKRTS